QLALTQECGGPKAVPVPPLIIAHRGASGTCPENTLVAFARAAALGAHMVELDAQLTRDGEVVVMHDWTLERTTDGAGRVCERPRGGCRGACRARRCESLAPPQGLRHPRRARRGGRRPPPRAGLDRE